MRRVEAAERRERQRAAGRRAAERQRAEARAERARTERFKSNCRKLGGSPKLFNTGDGSYWGCVAPWGGDLLNVPY